MKKLYRSLVTAAAFVLVCLIIMQGIQPVKYDIAVGFSCPVDIYAPRQVVDKLATERQKNLAAEQVMPQYTINNEITLRANRDLADIFNEINQVREKTYAGGDADALIGSFKYSVDKDVVRYCVLQSEGDYQRFRTQLTDVQKELMDRGVVNKEEAMTLASSLLAQRLGAPQDTANGLIILAVTISPNKELNYEATELERQRARDAVQSVAYKEGQIIVRRGDIVTEEQYAVLSDLGIVSGYGKVDAVQVTGVVILVFLSFFAVYSYMKSYNARMIKSDLAVMLIIIVVLNFLMVFAGRYTSLSLYSIPFFTGAILVAVLTDVRLGLLINVFLAVFFGVVLKADVYWILVTILAGGFGTFIYTRALARRGLVMASLAHCGLNVILFTASGLLEGIEVYDALIRGAYGVISTAVSSVLVIGTLPFWEYAFDVITPYKLLELSNPNHPLLKTLLVEAPGTYHHSLMVGNLAEAACEQIGANPLLARVGAYYHDIGKLGSPSFFKENQYGENPHDKMLPELSAAIITSHVKDGIDMARRYRLPEAIKGIIETHHGNSKVAYFYHKAKNSGTEEIDEDKFYYHHPRPSTKEQAVVMLADAAEAVVRALDDKSEDVVLKTVERIVRSRLEEGQLDKSELTLWDIDKVVSAFVKVFGGYFHSRIKYPEDGGNEQNNNKQ